MCITNSCFSFGERVGAGTVTTSLSQKHSQIAAITRLFGVCVGDDVVVVVAATGAIDAVVVVLMVTAPDGLVSKGTVSLDTVTVVGLVVCRGQSLGVGSISSEV